MKFTIAIMIALFLAAGLVFGTASGQPPIPSQEQPEVLTRGPVHEAFSEPVIMQIQAGLVVPNQPQADIEEIPPAERPYGDQYVWVPGYWSWDGDRNNYIWVSGCWRAAPPHMSWVPGYWSQVQGGWEWVAGFWTAAGIQEIEYLPAPPAYDDVQPPSSPLSQDNIWVPSCQYWYQGHFVRRPGYWLAAQQDWVWVPSHYIWTPRGYVFSEGHWDYPLEDRGVLFAPVYFPPSVYSRLGYSYSPSIVLDLGALVANLFTYPRYDHYYFGDYYDDSYLSIGIFPRYEVEQNHTWYDPTYVYDRWHHRDDPRWAENERNDYDRRHTNTDLRPPRTYREMEVRQANKLPEQQQNNFRMAEPLTAVVAHKGTALKFEHIDANAQKKIATEATAVHTFTAARSNWEAKPAHQESVQPPAGQKGNATTPAERKGSVTTPTERNKPVTTPAERKGTVTPPTERNNPVTTPVERKGSVTPPTERNNPVTTPAERKGTVTTPTERNRPAATPVERKGTVTSPAENQKQVTQPKETKTPTVQPREVQITQPERVKVPTPPVAGKQGGAVKSPPPQPVNERKDVGVVKVTPAKNQPAATTKDKVKETPKKKQPAGNAKDKAKDKGK